MGSNPYGASIVPSNSNLNNKYDFSGSGGSSGFGLNDGLSAGAGVVGTMFGGPVGGAIAAGGMDMLSGGLMGGKKERDPLLKYKRADMTADARRKDMFQRLASSNSHIYELALNQGNKNYMSATGQYAPGTLQRQQQDQWEQSKGGMRGMMDAYRNKPQGPSSADMAMGFKAQRSGQGTMPTYQRPDYGKAYDEGVNAVIEEQKKITPQQIAGFVGQLLPAIDFMRFLIGGTGEEEGSVTYDNIFRIQDAVNILAKEGLVPFVASLMDLGGKKGSKEGMYATLKNSELGKQLLAGRENRRENFSDLFRG